MSDSLPVSSPFRMQSHTSLKIRLWWSCFNMHSTLVGRKIGVAEWSVLTKLSYPWSSVSMQYRNNDSCWLLVIRPTSSLDLITSNRRYISNCRFSQSRSLFISSVISLLLQPKKVKNIKAVRTLRLLMCDESRLLPVLSLSATFLFSLLCQPSVCRVMDIVQLGYC